MRLLPRSLAGQLLALLILAMVASHLIAALILWKWGTSDQIHPLAVRKIEARLLSTYRLVVSHSALADSVLEALDLPESRFTITNPPPGTSPSMDDQEAALAQAIRDRLSLPAGQSVRAHLRQVDARSFPIEEHAPSWLAQALSGGNAWALDIDIDLPNGKSLHSRHWPAMMHPHWDRVLGFSLPVGVLPISLIAILFGRRIMRPLKRLALAAERFSRGDHPQQLPLEGPQGIREITNAFNEMQERLVRFVNGRTRMIAAIGHDLRTPLASLRIRAELIDDDELREAMILTLDEMSVMAEETLHFAQDDAKRESTRAVELSALINDAVSHHRMLGKEVEWTAPPATLYHCRPVHLKRALNNLIDNATRYGRTRVWLRLGEAGEDIRIEVEDEGPGIAPDQLDRAFEPFVRLDAARGPETGGTGLGLAIARSCIRAHGGEVTLHNRPEGGLLAVITLPA